MMRKWLPFLVMAVALSDRALAAPGGTGGGMAVIFNLLVFLGAMACLVISLRVFVLVKGGALARGWQMLIVSFVTLAAGQVFILAEKIGLFSLGFDIPGLLYLATVALWFAGLMQTRKVLE